MKIIEEQKAKSWSKCILCGGTKTYPNGNKYPICNVNIRYHNTYSGVTLTLCSACANELANALGNINYAEENTEGE